jgi:GH18 family chitinase
MREKNFDGVNLDFEGTGSGDQAGLTNLVTQVSSAIHQANQHYQVTMDTYASSGGDPNGFYNVKALAPAVDAFFVMQYQLNLQSGGSATSPLTSSMLSDKATIDQYVAAVPASKVILGLPYFGIDWPTNNGTLTAQATGAATTPSDGQVMSSGHPVYWDTTTDTAWTSYQVGSQWHETFFEDPTSLYEAAQLADNASLAGVGIWALGMDGNDPSMLSALLGGAAPIKEGGAGPTSTSESPSNSTTTTTSSPTSPTSSTTSSPTSTSTSTSTTSSTTTSTTSPAPFGGFPVSTTTTTAPLVGPIPPSSTPTSPVAYQYSGTWNGQQVTLSPTTAGTWAGDGTPAGNLTGFTTNDPTMSCLANAPLEVFAFNGNSNEYFVEAPQPNDCADAFFIFFAT